MDKNAAKELVKETFQDPFDKDRFYHFTKELLNHFEDAPFIYRGNFIPDAFDPYIKTLERIGKYQDPEEKQIDILIVNLKKEGSLEHARTMQRNFIAWYLNGSRGGKLKDAALVAFVSPNNKDWRFSLVKMEYKLGKTKTGQVRAKEELTPARRYSFLVGIHESSHTAQSRLVPIIEDDTHDPTLGRLEDAFNIEKVTKEFFEKYRELYLQVKEAVDDLVKKDSAIKKDFETKIINTVDFSKKLLGQIVFLYFLQKKGWFGVPRDRDWGEGDKQFMRHLFERAQKENKNYFNKFLEPLFYEALRLERPKDYYDQFDCRIPFLNGGLFDPINDYDWQNTDIIISNELFSNDIRDTKTGDIGTGILDVFDRYNFTVKEDEPLEKEVAVDPEMLGKVFENLLEVKDRKSKGTYYTPREIVHYMCQESLINYLYTELNSDTKPLFKDDPEQAKLFVKKEPKQAKLSTGKKIKKIPLKDIETLIKYGETVIEHEAEVESHGKETKTYSHKLPKSIRDNTKLIDEKLETIRICDPAVGSGAFPVGMMNEIIRTRNALTSYLKTKKGRAIYDFKRHAIQNSLYGVDVDPGAVEIAKLRLWLSLIVDEEDIKQIKPLPNLDYKIVCGNSLLGVKKNLLNYPLFNKLEGLKPLFFNETNTKKKQEYKNQIDELINQITSSRKNFDFEVYFSEVFHDKKGFDVIIANPPYISYGLRGGQKMSEGEKEFLRRTFPNSAEYKISLYAIFMDKAINIAKPDGGLQTFIVPDSFLLGRYFSKIRKFILETNEIVSILLLPYGVFQATVGFSVVYLFQRKPVVGQTHKLIARYADDNEVVRLGSFKEYSYPQAYFNGLRHNRFRLFFNKQTTDIISKIEKNSVELGTIVRFSSGLIGKEGQDSITNQEKKNNKWLPGIISGSEFHRYFVKPEGNFLLYDKSKIKSGYEGVDYFNEKILMRQTGDALVCVLDDSKLLALNNVHIGNLTNRKFSLKYIVAVLNSFLVDYYYKSISLEAGRVMAQIDIETLEGMAIKDVSPDTQKPFVGLVDNILTLTKDKDYFDNSIKQAKVRDYEKQIDQLVYKLYGLTPDEIKVVENHG